MSTAAYDAAFSKLRQFEKDPIRSIARMTAAFAQLQDDYNLITPLIPVDFIPPMWRISLRAVMPDLTMNAEGQGTEVYRDKQWCGPDEAAPTKILLLKILNAGGCDLKRSERIDDGSIPLFWHWQVTGEILQLDGRTVTRIADKVIDLRDGSPEIAGWSAARIAMARRHAISSAEAKAVNKLTRQCFALPQKYTMKQLAKPFVIPALVFDPDISDPAIKQLVTIKALKLEQVLYGPRTAVGIGMSAPAMIETTDGKVDTSTGEIVDDFDVPPPPPAAPAASAHPEAACECEHGCQVPISAVVAEKTKGYTGRALCEKCYPFGKGFDFPLHQNLASLKLEKHPKLTPSEAAAYSEKLRKGA